LLSAADQKVRMCTAVVNQNSGPARSHIGIISVEAELVVGRKPVRDTEAARGVELENAVSKSSRTVPDAVSSEDIQADGVIDGICGGRGPPAPTPRGGRTPTSRRPLSKSKKTPHDPNCTASTPKSAKASGS